MTSLVVVIKPCFVIVGSQHQQVSTVKPVCEANASAVTVKANN